MCLASIHCPYPPGHIVAVGIQRIINFCKLCACVYSVYQALSPPFKGPGYEATITYTKTYPAPRLASRPVLCNRLLYKIPAPKWAGIYSYTSIKIIKNEEISRDDGAKCT